jgi:ELWxxDGT repeat protein
VRSPRADSPRDPPASRACPRAPELHEGTFLIPLPHALRGGAALAAIATSLLAGAATAPAATPLQATPLQTLNPQNAGSNPASKAVDAGGVGYITASDGDHGSELFRIDGTGMPHVVKDILPGPDGSGPDKLTAVDSDVYFAAQDPAHGIELWRSDGTAAGTVRVKDIAPGTDDSNINQLVASGGKLYFTADDRTGTTGQELWVSDGTSAGTHLVKDIDNGNDGSEIAYMKAFDGGVAFDAYDGNDYELWVSDGTQTGTTKVDVAPGSDSSFAGPFAVLGSELYFAADDGSGDNTELYKSDGTTATLVKDLDGNPNSSSAPGQFTVIGSTLYFAAGQGGYGSELWSSDGTGAGTHVVKTINGGPDADANSLTAVGSTLYFAANDYASGQDYEVWSTDGTNAGTRLVKDVNGDPTTSSYPRELTAVGSHLDFVANDGAGDQLWTTDGTAAGTTKLSDAADDPADLSAIGGLLSFDVDDGVHGREPGISDGTAAGTVVHDLNTSGLSDPGAAVTLGGLRLFTAETGSGRSVFVTDGTAAGSHALAVTATVDTREIAVMGGKAYFFAQDGGGNAALFATDGTDAGTQEITQQRPGAGGAYLTAAGDHLFFSGYVSHSNDEPFVSDGTAAGTGRVKDISAGGSSEPSGFTPLGSKVVFTAYDGSGVNAWVSDGTAAGTLKLSTTADTSTWIGAAAFGGKVYFNAGGRLWATDGTPGGTAVVAAFSAAGTNPSRFTVAESKLYFNADDGTGTRLLSYDGTGAPVGLTVGGLGGGFSLTPFGGGLLFADATSGELTVTDGTPAGTHGLGSSVARVASVQVIGSKAYFTGEDAGHGDELWSTDGTASGTTLVADLADGATSSHAAPLAQVDGDLLALAEEPGTGTVLTRLNTSAVTDTGGGAQNGGGGSTTTTTTTTGTTTPATTTRPAPAPAAKPRAKARGLSLKVSRSAGRRPPFRIAVSGKLKPATGITAKAACTGTITITARRGNVRVLSIRVKLRSDCTYRATLTKTTTKHLSTHGGKLTLTARFSGNTTLLPTHSATRTTHYGA